MSCVCCFFDDENQKKIKESCFGEKSFEGKLQLYKLKYIAEFKKMDVLSKCACDFAMQNFKNATYVKFCDDMLNDCKGKIELIEEIFDVLIKIYNLCERNHREEAFLKLKDFFENYCTNYSSINAIQMCDILFRGREVGSYDLADIHEYYHVPFSIKDKVGNQRFSVKGKPMLYLAKSIPTASRELKLDFEKINFALYFPKYSWVYGRSMYDFSNVIDVEINRALAPLMDYGSKIEYDNQNFTFSKNNSNRTIGDGLLFQILTFPVENKKGVCNEYLLPQLCTEYFERKGYLGFVYQSTKSAEMFQGAAKYSQRDYNYCFFVPEEAINNYNEKLLSCFHAVCIGGCERGKKFSDVIKAIADLKVELKEQNKVYNMIDYSHLMHKIESHIEYMEQIKVGPKDYYDSEQGYVEIDLIYKLLSDVREIVNSPAAHGIARNNTL